MAGAKNLVTNAVKSSSTTNSTNISTNSSDITTLEGLVNGHEIISVSIEDAANAAASTTVTLTGAVATDVAIAIAADLSNGSATFLKTAVAGTDQVVVTFDANTATGDKFNLLVIRPSS